jgi:putative transposase
VVSKEEQERRLRTERSRQVALFRYGVIQDLLDPQLSARQRGVLIGRLVAEALPGPFGEPVTVSKTTLHRWRRAFLTGGFDALVPDPRQSTPRLAGEVVDMAVALKRENSLRTATQIRRIMQAAGMIAPSERTLQRWFDTLELNLEQPGRPEVFGRFEAERPNALWTGDALHGPKIDGRKTYLFCFIDDHSRAVMAARWAFHEDVVRLAAALRPALATRGVPERVYLDNGSAFVDSWLKRACAVLGIKLVHSKPGRPQGRGKIERFFRVVREQFLVEVATSGEQTSGTQIEDLGELNRLFHAWVETVYHQRTHSETGHKPLQRWLRGLPALPPVPDPALLREAFRWSQTRKASANATVELHGNTYEIDAGLARRTVELVFDPFDLTDIDVRHHGKPFGKATPFLVTRHAHRKTRTGADPADAPPTSIDYLGLLGTAHDRDLRDRLNFSALLEDQDQHHDKGQ